jgi:glycosyltransferase involved in cell wall biosynthesis
MHFFIVTPSFNQLSYLKRCVASIRDQAPPGATVEHWVIDGGSADGTVEWLQAEKIAHISEPDEGMYAALNKGLNMLCEYAREDTLFAWLNCDEQYLPGALEMVANDVRRDVDIDIRCGNALVIGPDGHLLTHWKSMPLRAFYMTDGTLYNLTCAMFFRADIFKRGVRFHEHYRALADVAFVQRLIKDGARMSVIPHFLSAYTYTAGNLSNKPAAALERRRFIQSCPWPLRWAARAARAVERKWRGVDGGSFPFTYEIYTKETSLRTRFTAHYVPRRWPEGNP